MAFSHAVTASTFVMLVSLSFGQEELLKNSIIRRHNQEKTVGMNAKAHFYDVNTGFDGQNSKKMTELSEEEFLKQRKMEELSGEPLYSNRAFTFAAEDAPNTCVDSLSIGSDTLCQEAALRLGFAWNGTADNNWVAGAALQMPKNCSVSHGVVHWNPTQPEPETYEASGGRAICLRLLYVDGTATSSGATSCPNSDYQVIDGAQGEADEKLCRVAANIVVGKSPAGCRMPEFDQDDTVEEDDRPKGCFREPAMGADHQDETFTMGNGITSSSAYGRTGSRKGCFNYNSKAPTGTAVEGNPVCKLKDAAITAARNTQDHMKEN
jgi:hypothetical protein